MSGTSNVQEKRRQSAEQYRSNVIAAGAQGRAGAEMQRAHQLEDGAAKLRTDAAQDSAVARSGARMRP